MAVYIPFHYLKKTKVLLGWLLAVGDINFKFGDTELNLVPQDPCHFLISESMVDISYRSSYDFLLLPIRLLDHTSVQHEIDYTGTIHHL